MIIMIFSPFHTPQKIKLKTTLSNRSGNFQEYTAYMIPYVYMRVQKDYLSHRVQSYKRRNET